MPDDIASLRRILKNCRTIAVVGLSADWNRPSNFAAKYMQQHGLNYRVINDIVGAAEGAKAEFQRRVAAPYEDKKILQNGDVYVGKETNGGV